MTVPTITALPEIPAYSDANFETKAPAFLSFLKNTFQAEMNAAIAAINSYDYEATANISKVVGLTAGYIPYGAGTSALASNANLNYDAANSRLNTPVLRASTGVLFGDDTAAANTLDDYDSVNFTPEFTPQTGEFDTITYTYRHGRCIKIGKQVTLQIYLTTSNVILGTATGILCISGLPYAIRNTLPNGVAGSVAYMHTWGSDMSNVRVWGYRGESVLSMTKNATNAASSAIQVSDLAVGAGNKNVIVIGITYFTN